MKKLFSILFFVAISPLYLFASNDMARATGISDGILLALMVGVIILLLVIVKALANTIEVVCRNENSTVDKKEKTNPGKTTLVGLLLMLSSLSAQAQVETPKTPEFILNDTLFWMLVSLIIFLTICIAVLFRTLNTIVKKQNGVSFGSEEAPADLLKQLKLTDNVPIEEEVTVMMDHEYDGIRELDNNLPPWWKYMFYATIIFAFIYLIRFHITGDGQLSHEEYMAQMTAAEEEKAAQMANAAESVTEDNVVLLVDAPSIEKGAAIYQGNCATCHGQLGEGGAGPNLTDDYWLHGGGIKNVFKTIKYGVPAKGMIAWQTQFSPSQMQKIASYVLSLHGTNPPNGKAPQGEKYIEEEIENTVEEIDTDSLETADL